MNQRIQHLINLGQLLQDMDTSIIQSAVAHNGWFTEESIRQSIQAICGSFLQKDVLEKWLDKYTLDTTAPKTVGLILAGNIPLVGFHDVMSVYLSGHKVLAKLSDKDSILMDFVITNLQNLDQSNPAVVIRAERLNEVDAVIATGSNNSSFYFKKYFGHLPHIIRQNRNAIAVLDGNETDEDLHLLGQDIFTYYGLGCRNVSKVYIPQGYDLTHLLEALHEYNEIVNHHKYKSNFDYNIALYMLNKQKYLNNGSIMILESPQIPSRIATLHYQYYNDIEDVKNDIQRHQDQIQCVVSHQKIWTPTFQFGEAQHPAIDDYADGIDTLQFLSNL